MLPVLKSDWEMSFLCIYGKEGLAFSCHTSVPTEEESFQGVMEGVLRKGST
jgi:hypothetical protein